MGINSVVRRLGLKKKPTGWWVTDMPSYYADGEGPFTECGPYTTKGEAEEDRNGMQRTLDKIGYEDEEQPKEEGSDKKPTRRKGQGRQKTVKEDPVEEDSFW